jgi:hypothetical protein
MRKAALTPIAIAASTLVVLVVVPTAPAFATADKDFGCTVRQNIESQTVDMNPKYQGTLMEGGIGQRSASAVNRYMTDKVKPLLSIDGRSEVGRQGGVSQSGDSAGGGK